MTQTTKVKVVTGNVRFSYANVFQPKAAMEGGTPKYSVSIIIPKSDKDTISRLQKAFDETKAASAALFGGTVPKTLKGGLRDGDAEKDDPVYAGSYFINANSAQKPGVVDADLNPIINADDFYGKNSFEKAVYFLNNHCNEKSYAIIGYELAKTLSDHGTVSRGVCKVDSNGKLISIKERTKIYKTGDKIVFEENGIQEQVPFDSSVSMNFWCFPPSMFVTTENLFHEFVRENFADIKAEFFIPLLGDNFVQNQGGSIQVIPTSAQWFGVTYKEDAPIVKASVEKLVSDGEYPISLWA
jgi:hypothetical protein